MCQHERYPKVTVNRSRRGYLAYTYQLRGDEIRKDTKHPDGSSESSRLVLLSLSVLAGMLLGCLPLHSQTNLTWTINHVAGAQPPDPQYFTVAAAGISQASNVTVSYKTLSGGDWLTMTPLSGSTPLNVTATFHPGNLGPGTYEATLTVKGAGNDLTGRITLIVVEGQITTRPTEFSFDYVRGAPNPSRADSSTLLVMSNLANPPFPGQNFTASAVTDSGGNWLAVSPASGQVTKGSSWAVQVLIAPSGLTLTEGQYAGQIVLKFSKLNKEVVVPVSLRVTSPPLFSTSVQSLDVRYRKALSPPVPVPVTVDSDQPDTDFTISTQSSGSWLSATADRNRTPATLTLKFDPSKLGIGTYTGQVSVQRQGSATKGIDVRLVVAPELRLSSSKSALSFSYKQGETDPVAQAISIDATEQAPFKLRVSASAPWLVTDLTEGSTPGPIQVRVKPAGLGLGQYQGTIQVESGEASNSPITIPVTLDVRLYDPWQLSWDKFADEISSYFRRGASNAEWSTAFDGKPVFWEGTLSRVDTNTGRTTYQIAMPSKQVALPAGGTAPMDSVILTPSAANAARWLNTPAQARLIFRTNLVSTASTAAASVVAATPPTIRIATQDAELIYEYRVPTLTNGGVVNGASLQTGITAGSWIAISGRNLSPVTRTWTAADIVGNRLPKVLDTVRVQVNGKDAAIYYISPTQVNAIAPAELNSGSASVTLTNAVGTALPVQTPVQEFAPAFFAFDYAGQRYVVAVHADGTLVLPGAPARPGEIIVIYGTGFGPTDPALPADEVFVGAAVLASSASPTVRVAGTPARVHFAGLVSAGLYQLNVEVPDVAAGNEPVSVEMNGNRSSQDISLSVGVR